MSLASETMMVHKILSDPDWKATRWILKNRFPDRYRDLTRAELSGADGGPIPLEHSGGFVVNVSCKALEEEELIDGGGDPAGNEKGL